MFFVRVFSLNYNFENYNVYYDLNTNCILVLCEFSVIMLLWIILFVVSWYGVCNITGTQLTKIKPCPNCNVPITMKISFINRNEIVKWPSKENQKQ